MVIAPARRAGDPGSIPSPGENFSLKLCNYVSTHGKMYIPLKKNRSHPTVYTQIFYTAGNLQLSKYYS